MLLSILEGYKRPNDKINTLVEKGFLTPVKKGLYITGPALNAGQPASFLIANHLCDPSYVSIDTALSFYGLIPERVYEISSVTTKTSREYITSVGVFSFTHLPSPYYSLGIRRLAVSDGQYMLMATPEKALFDKIVTTKSIILRSKTSAFSHLVENLRMDEDGLKEMDTNIMQEWLPHAPKKESLLYVIKTINDL
ncbi:hypothetical protein [Chitinophaga sp. SYP-B3965]|uniref:type IV toxin-antitoxin system AbiEi family antitoxin domain-containing protein n=1 Tax=Chitinophaga sp. SYP-B3965 TaxID=2663120 RepID=UPI001C12BED7|nr:hypothetical protein [Chitinophaga sp. SYP-B3965]